MFAGHNGSPVDWTELMNAAAWADVIIIGEQHDDGVGHAVQLAVVEDVASRFPRIALCLEMLERDEQALLDDYMEGLISKEDLAKLTFSQDWGAKGGWANWYQPIIDAAKERGASVVAGNAPRRYVRLARTHGYERLRALPANRRKLFDIPAKPSNEAYRQRFFDVMTPPPPPEVAPPPEAVPPQEVAPHSVPEVASQTEAVPPAEQSAEEELHADSVSPAAQPSEPATQPAAELPKPGANPHDDKPPTEAQLRAGFRSQSIWDATMAASMARAKRSGARKVVQLIGQFHSDFNGGTVQQLRNLLPHARILTISMQRENAVKLRSEDRNRADIVIYTGQRPSEQDEGEGDEPASQPATAPAEPATQPAAETVQPS